MNAAELEIGKGDALLVVDVQKDFCPGGRLPVPGGDEIVPVIDDLMREFRTLYASKDFHPVNHKSFATNAGVEVFTQFDLNGTQQMAWPPHCVQGTTGADFHPDLPKGFQRIFVKGMNPEHDSYSAVQDSGGNKTLLIESLNGDRITRVFVCGLATDYCVKATAIDLANEGFDVVVITDACRGIGDKTAIQAAFDEMKAAGCVICTSGEIFAAD